MIKQQSPGLNQLTFGQTAVAYGQIWSAFKQTVLTFEQKLIASGKFGRIWLLSAISYPKLSRSLLGYCLSLFVFS